MESEEKVYKIGHASLKLRTSLKLRNNQYFVRHHKRQVRDCETEMWSALKQLRHVLGSKYYKLMKLRYIENKTLEQVGKEMGVTRERIRQIEHKVWAIIKFYEDDMYKHNNAKKHE